MHCEEEEEEGDGWGELSQPDGDPDAYLREWEQTGRRASGCDADMTGAPE